MVLKTEGKMYIDPIILKRIIFVFSI
jgi:hypothetical protein